MRSGVSCIDRPALCEGLARRWLGQLAIVNAELSGDMLYLPLLRSDRSRLGHVPVVYPATHVFDGWNLRSRPALVLGMDVLTQFELVALDFGHSGARLDFV